MDNFIFLPDRSKVSAGNSATGELSVALGKNCTASGNYSVAMGYCSSATGQNSFADGSGCDASGSESVAMGWGCRTAHHATGGRQIAVGNLCYAEGSQSVAMGHACYAGSNGAVAMGYDCSAQGGRAFAMGENCDASGSHSVALGNSATTISSQTVALGSSPLATGPLVGSRSVVPPGTTIDISNIYFVYRSPLGNSIEFVDKTVGLNGKSSDFGSNIGLRYRSVDGSASELIFAAPAGSGGAAPVGTSLRVAYTTTVVNNQTLTSIATTFPDLPHDARSVSVTAWGPGAGSLCGGGVTFNIPSSMLRSWHWGGFQDTEAHFRLWQASDGVVAESVGYKWVVEGGGAAWATSNSTPADVGITNPTLWNYPGGAAGVDGTGTGGLGKVPGAASSQANLAAANTFQNAGIKVQWIE